MIVDVPTVYLALILVSATLALTTGMSISPGRDEGLTFWALAFAMIAVTYTLLILRGRISPILSIWIANALFSASFSVITEGVLQFQRRAPRRVLIWSPAMVLILLFLLNYKDGGMRTLVASAIFLFQCIAIIVIATGNYKDKAGSGHYIFVSGMSIAVVIFGLRVLGAITGLARPRAILTPGPVEIATAFATIFCLLVIAHGQLVMIKDRADERVRALARLDPLTGLANRRLMEEMLAKEWARAKRARAALALVMVDVDSFKKFNDIYGHQAGDRCLTAIAEVLRTTARRASDLAARYGGEEFLLILPDLKPLTARSLAEQIRQSVEALGIDHPQTPFGKVTVSAGVAAMGSEEVSDVETLLGLADGALYRAKQAGGNQVEVAFRLAPGASAETG
jgi:diguanylate cyclase (GGDEF)-like protein